MPGSVGEAAPRPWRGAAPRGERRRSGRSAAAGRLGPKAKGKGRRVEWERQEFLRFLGPQFPRIPFATDLWSSCRPTPPARSEQRWALAEQLCCSVLVQRPRGLEDRVRDGRSVCALTWPLTRGGFRQGFLVLGHAYIEMSLKCVGACSNNC